MLSLARLRSGQTAQITQLRSDPDLSRRLEALGLKVGQLVRVIRRAPLSGPIQVRVGTTDIILRRRDADAIHLQLPDHLATAIA